MVKLAITWKEGPCDLADTAKYELLGSNPRSFSHKNPT